MPVPYRQPETKANENRGRFALGEATPELDKLLLESRRSERRRRLLLIAAAAISVAVIVYGLKLRQQRAPPTTLYSTVPVTRGLLIVRVTATGTLQPITQVDVGTEVSGTVESVLVDFNDHVKVGQVIARLDTAQLAAKERQSRAALRLAEARVTEAAATELETRQKLRRSTRRESRPARSAAAATLETTAAPGRPQATPREID